MPVGEVSTHTFATHCIDASQSRSLTHEGASPAHALKTQTLKRSAAQGNASVRHVAGRGNHGLNIVAFYSIAFRT